MEDPYVAPNEFSEALVDYNYARDRYGTSVDRARAASRVDPVFKQWQKSYKAYTKRAFLQVGPPPEVIQLHRLDDFNEAIINIQMEGEPPPPPPPPRHARPAHLDLDGGVIGVPREAYMGPLAETGAPPDLVLAEI